MGGTSFFKKFLGYEIIIFLKCLNPAVLQPSHCKDSRLLIIDIFLTGIELSRTGPGFSTMHDNQKVLKQNSITINSEN
jgi:hypothetical protein